MDESDENGGDPMSYNYDIRDIADDTLGDMIDDCDDFRDYVAEHLGEDYLAESGLSDESADHDFWLTRNGSGAVFWDRDLGEVGDDGQIYTF